MSLKSSVAYINISYGYIQWEVMHWLKQDLYLFPSWQQVARQKKETDEQLVNINCQIDLKNDQRKLDEVKSMYEMSSTVEVLSIYLPIIKTKVSPQEEKRYFNTISDASVLLVKCNQTLNRMLVIKPSKLWNNLIILLGSQNHFLADGSCQWKTLESWWTRMSAKSWHQNFHNFFFKYFTKNY